MGIDDQWQCPVCFKWYEYTVKQCAVCREGLWDKLCPPEFKATDPKRLKPGNLQGVMAWEMNPKGLIIFGDTGLGKTRAAMLLMKREFDAGKNIDIFIGARFSNECGKVFYENRGEEWLEKLIKADVVFLDDIDKLKMTQCVQWAFFSLIDTRINWQRPTILTTNLTSKILMSFFEPQFRDALNRRLHEFFITVLFK